VALVLKQVTHAIRFRDSCIALVLIIQLLLHVSALSAIFNNAILVRIIIIIIIIILVIIFMQDMYS
jgi:hypothetical protein